ncbi:MAG TPA: hypothetical protein ENO16_06545 [Chromatiales bacterium]|nr:hypothetical protein [Chromatiales bacterium]
MKKLLIANLCVAGLLSSAAWAGDTATVTVSATVVGTCQFNSNGTVGFTLDPSVGGNVTGTVSNPEFWCTKNASWTITDDLGLNEAGTQRNMKNAGTDLIPYSFGYTSTGTGEGKSTPITMNIAASVAEADYIDKPAGSYSDTVTLTIAP